MTGDDHDLLEPSALADLLRWGFKALGDGWGDTAPVDAIVAEYTAAAGFRQEPWPAFGLELHLPAQPTGARRMDLCLMRWHGLRRSILPQQWRVAPVTAPGLTYAADFSFAEYDSVEGALHPMGQFHNVSGGDAKVWPEGTLRELHRLCGAPKIIGLTPGRGEGVTAVLFQLQGDSAWHHVPALLETHMSIAGLADRIGALEALRARGVTVRVGVSTTCDGRLLPRGGLELSGLAPDEETARILVAAGASRHAVEEWIGLCHKLPFSERIDRPLPEAPALAFPWQMRAVHSCYVKLGLQEGAAPLKLYVRVDGLPAQESAIYDKLTADGLQDSDYKALSTLRADARRGADGRDQHEAWWEATRQDLPDAARALPFAPLLWPILRGQWNRMVTDLGPECLGRMDEAACDALLVAGLKRLVTELGQSLHHAWRGTAAGAGEKLLLDIGVVGGVTPQEKAAEVAWCRSQLRSGLAAWLVAQPVAAGRLVSLVQDWASATSAMLRRIAADGPDLLRNFSIGPEHRLASVMPDLGDRHDGGKSVHGLVFVLGGDVRRLCYKPRSLQPERCWQALWHGFAEGLPDPPPAAPSHLDFGTHSYMEWVDASPPATPDEARRFCRNAGRMLALFHILGAGDVHAGNLVSRSEGPVIVDAELLFDGNHGPWTEDSDETPPPLWRDSVLSSGMLPSRLRGAFGGWVDLVLPDILHDRAALEAGFHEMGQIVLSRGEAIVRAIALFAELPRRVLLRSTNVYATFLAALRSPGALVSRQAAKTIMAPLRSGKAASTPFGTALAAAEEGALLRGDVPLFVLDTCDIRQGTPLSDVLAAWTGGSQAAARAQKRLAQFRGDLDWQAKLLAMASAGLGHWPRRVSPPEPRPDHLPPKLARWVRDCLVDEVERHPTDGRLLWLTWRWEPSLALYTVAEVLPGLYSGYFGALAFLYAWCQNHPLDREAAALLAEVETRPPLFPSWQGFGYDGLAGHLRLAFCMGRPLALDAASLAPLLALDETGQEADFVNGCAGLMSALSLYDAAPLHPVATELAARLATRCRDAAALAASGLAHGRSGMAIALIAVGNRWGNDDWTNAGATLLSDVVDRYDPSANGWTDGAARNARPATGWCRGSTGIGLALGRALALAPDHSEARKWRQGLDRAVAAVLRAPADTLSATPLCCGSIGAAVALQILGTEQDRPDWRAEGEARLDTALRQWMEQAQLLPIGLMEGLSGIGLSALWRGKEARRFLPLLV